MTRIPTRSTYRTLGVLTVLVALAAGSMPARAQASGTTRLRLRLESVVALRIGADTPPAGDAASESSPENTDARVLHWSLMTLGPRGWLQARVLRDGRQSASWQPTVRDPELRLCVIDAPARSGRDAQKAPMNRCTIILGDSADADSETAWLVVEHY